MQNGFTRAHKIDLTISRRARSALAQSITNHNNIPQYINQKQKPSHKKMIELTISTKMAESQHQLSARMDRFPQKETDLALSQLVLSKIYCGEIGKESKTMLNSVEQIQNEEMERWGEYLRGSEGDSKIELIGQLVKRQKKIQYFSDLLRQNSKKFQTEKRERVRRYESYLSKLKEMYREELQENQKLSQLAKQIDEQRNEEFYRLLRMKINRDGQRGLNFTPKRMSLFSGITGTLLLSNRSDESEGRRRREEQFIFDYELTMKRNNSSCNKLSVYNQQGYNQLLRKANQMCMDQPST